MKTRGIRMSNVLLQNDLEEVREVFAINDLSGATWAFRKLRAIEEKKKEITSIAIEEKKRIDEWLSKESKSLDDDKAYFEGLLSAIYDAYYSPNKPERIYCRNFYIENLLDEVVDIETDEVKFEKVLGVQFQVEEKSKIFILHFYYVKINFILIQ